jgi:N-acetylneuraminate synthase/N,N'-diacetyllegionaminate synthase
MRIGTRQIGDGAPVYVIAEIGVNHDGSPMHARGLDEAAAAAGADAVKFQLFRADLLMSRASRLAAYQESAGESDPFSMLRRLELSAAQMSPLVDAAHALGLHAIVTVFSVELVPEAQRLPWDAYKTASPDLVHRPLLDALAATGKPLIVSTGAAEFAEVRRAVEWLAPARERLAVLQCVSSYPTRAEDAAIRGMEALRELPGLRGRIGYSDHTSEVDTGDLAADAGACVLERHLTYDKGAAGPDHAASLDPGEFRRYAELARDAWTLRQRVGTEGPTAADPRLGEPVKRVQDCERDVRTVSRQSIVARRAIGSGATLMAEDLTFKRPGTGIAPWRLAELVGRRAAWAIEADMPLTEGDIR